MWLRIVLLIIYIAVLFVIARLLETFAWYDAGLLAHRLLDPMTLSVKKLKALLEQRGVGYEGIVEKKELTGLVEATGVVTDDEVLEVGEIEDPAEVTNFTSGYDFYEQVEDTKDSVWLVQVIASGHNSSFINNASWKTVRKKVAKFGVRAGVMDCSLDWKLCRNKGWYSSQVILSLPENFKTKANVVMYVYNGPAKPSSMFKWVKNKLNRKVKQIADYDELKREWLSFQKKYEIRVVLFTELASIPLIFSALSVKFPGRVRFGTMNSKSGSGKETLARLKLKPPACFVIAPGKTLVYGSRPGELLTFRSMENFLKSLYPEVNDFFILSLIVTNLMGWFELFLSQGSLFRRLLRLICCCIKYNIVLIILWQPLLALFQLSYFEILLEWGLLALHFLSGSSIGSIIRKDLIFYSNSRYLLLGTFSLYSLLVGYIQYKRKNGMIAEDEFDWFNFAQLLNFNPLLNPSFQIVHPGGLYAMYLLESSDMLFGHFPDLVVTEMQSVVSSDYIKHLPRWKYGRVLNHNENSKLKCSHKDDVENLIATPNHGFCSGSPDFESGDNPAIQMMDGNYCCGCMQRNAASSESCVSTSPPPDLSEEQQSRKSNDVCCPLHKRKHSSASSADECKHNSLRSASSKANAREANHLVCSENYKLVPDGFLQTSQCVICLEDFVIGADICGLPCAHFFHECCILRWLYRMSYACPMCRWLSYNPKPGLDLCEIFSAVPN
ncbi:E3 ubiquitin-protein ligase RNF103-like [Octopus vulgaris]|uniref:E3 ubiquitin-protein ligase RNF103-like n=1 Tax=Octopus vulgaris TaxID=6645 RepID=A0AA36BQI9_OCTVU|nr:E3 ubiquitin-protein ligase RNF103-like [Octopus vulgaris]